MCVYIYEHMYTCIHNHNRMKESHNNGQFYSLYLMKKNATYKYVEIYILDCA